ncbi:(5-formylfuran-3-yl)methyl phosphate synthase [Methylobrevis pamukkalensis]|uniref:(5-formylfuran-3-yl)methyl phosphate synthase n=1 Tax=Methylobrevis pamukkalensis TaxID=1439726 RepID=A0A1E3H768_9HYPH|nr:(5-formylfuran-3-yl)methyl phosphate synthase [Methylobrevis pamukkalensis]ODN71351.1 hypothetical protein A6302_01303 [Methylobrevis pamukkalensis]
MTLLLVSVTNAEEAHLAVEAGADLIDAKDPAAGALGALTPATVAEIVAAVDGRATVTAVCGDHLRAETLLDSAEAMAATGVDMVKIGFVPDLADARVIRAAGRLLGTRTKLVAVLFADLVPDFGLVPVLAEAGFHGVMLDTSGKSAGLLSHLSTMRIFGFVSTARTCGLISGLAGSVRIADLPAVAGFGPDLVGMRGGVCRGGRRTSALDPDLVRMAAARLRAMPCAAQAG